MTATEQHDVDAMVAAFRILQALNGRTDADTLWFEIGRAQGTLRVAVGSRADISLVQKAEAAK
jgi:hypothetical protein